MVEKTEQDNERTFSVWPRIIAMFTSFVLVAVVFTAVAFLYPPVEAPKPDRPHIIFILADDLGWNDVSVHGSPQIPTPNLDALAASGLLLNNYYTNPQCTPSRGALLAGKYAHRLGLQRDLRPSEASGLPLNVDILPGYLKRLGYATHMVGKWHLGYHKKRYLPTRRGFDSFFGFLNDNIDYYDYTCYYKETSPESNGSDMSDSDSESESTQNSGNVELFGIDLWENEEVIRNFRGEYITDVLTEKALDIIEDHNVTKPLFLYISEAAARAGNPFFPVQSPANLYERNNHIGNANRRTYAGVVSSLDDSIGRVFESLHKKDMLRKSILVISSDNGGAVEAGSNWPLRGAKASLWEGGVRSLAMVWSPLLKLKKPAVSQNLMHITDWLPSLFYAAGGDVTDLGDIDGINMWPGLLKSKSPRDEVLLHVDSVSGGLRKGDYKLLVSSMGPSDWYSVDDDTNVTLPLDEWVWTNGSLVKNLLMETDRWLLPENGSTWRQEAAVECGENFLPVSGKCDFALGPCLYNIKDDPCEYKNIANLYPEIVDKLLDRLRDLNASTLPVESKPLDPLGNPLCHDFAHVPWMDEEEFDCPLI